MTWNGGAPTSTKAPGATLTSTSVPARGAHLDALRASAVARLLAALDLRAPALARGERGAGLLDVRRLDDMVLGDGALGAEGVEARAPGWRKAEARR